MTTTLDPSALNIRVLVPLASYLRERVGAEALEQAAREAGLAPGDFDGTPRWLTQSQCERFLARARTWFEDDGQFRDACRHGFDRKSYGWLVLFGRATTPWTAYVLGAKIMPGVVMRGATFHTAREGSRCTIRYQTAQRESHLLCLVRQSHMAAIPTMWGLPPTRIEHPRCIARGDACCEYTFTLVEPARWLPAALGLGAGLLALPAVGALTGEASEALLLCASPLLGLLAGLCYEWRRASHANQRAVQDAEQGLIELAREDAEAREELFAIERRQREWARLAEEQLIERTQQHERILAEVRALEERHTKTIRALSHDLKNPLTALNIYTRIIRTEEASPEIIDALAAVSAQMSQLVERLLDAAAPAPVSRPLEPRTLHVPELVGRLGRRLRALCHLRDIRTSVTARPDAPDALEIDELVFDRVVDNLLTNATKYTDSGSITVELGGPIPGFVTLVISDTGRGIDPGSLERVFQPGGSAPAQRAAQSHGVGLSVVVQLLSQIGGRLEVCSEPGKGSTFAVHFPVSTRTSPATRADADAVPAVVFGKRSSTERWN